jgi:hypothetical protein
MRSFVEAVPGMPLPFSLLGNCADIVDVTDPHQLLGTEHRELSCTDTHDTTWCPPTGDPFPLKSFERPGICEADPVTIYAGIICSTMGWDYDESVAHATETLRMGESRALEAWFQREVLCELATDVTPAAGAMSVTQALGVLESNLAQSYGGVGVIHAPVGMAAMFAHGQLASTTYGCEDGCCMRTLAGNLVVFGAGYDSVNVGPDGAGGCVVAPAGEAWLYATPAVRIRRGPVDVLPVEEAQGIRLQTNERMGLAERTFVPELACCLAYAVRTNLTVCD